LVDDVISDIITNMRIKVILFWGLTLLLTSCIVLRPKGEGPLAPFPNDAGLAQRSQAERNTYEPVLVYNSVPKKCDGNGCEKEWILKLTFKCADSVKPMIEIPLRYKFVKITALDSNDKSPDGKFPLTLKSDGDGVIVFHLVATNEYLKHIFKITVNGESVVLPASKLIDPIVLSMKACSPSAEILK
jgi:hypothetical protein